MVLRDEPRRYIISGQLYFLGGGGLMEVYVSPDVTGKAIKAELETRKGVLLEEPWFKNTKKLEGFDLKSVETKLSSYIKDLKEEDNLYRLGKEYWIAQDRHKRYKYRNMPI